MSSPQNLNKTKLTEAMANAVWRREASPENPKRKNLGRKKNKPEPWPMLFGGGRRRRRTLSGHRSACLSLAFCPGLGFGLGFRVQGSGFRVQGSGFRVQGSGFRDWLAGPSWGAWKKTRSMIMRTRLVHTSVVTKLTKRRKHVLWSWEYILHILICEHIYRHIPHPS